MIDPETYFRISYFLTFITNYVLVGSLSSSELKPYEDRSTSTISFTFSKKRKAFAIVIILLWVALGFSILISGLSSEDFTILSVFCSFMIAIVAIRTIKLFRTVYRITRDGIDKHSWFRRTFIAWADIEVVHLGFFVRSRFIIKSSKGKVKLNTHMTGFKVITKAIRDNVAYEKWQKALPPKYLDCLL